MPSSISSSNAPAGPWARTWGVALVLAIGGFLALDRLERQAGHVPSVVDDKALWAYWRDRVYSSGNEPKPLVLLGASRIQLGFDTDEFRRIYPDRRVVQLAVDGAHPLAVLRDLARDEKFDGVVLCDVTGPSFEPDAIEEQQPWVAYHDDQWHLDREANRAISSYLQAHFVALNPRLDSWELVHGAIHGRGFPEPNYILTKRDRSRLATYALVGDVADHRDKRVARAKNYYEKKHLPTPEEWLANTRAVEPWVEAIQKRGGKVVFFRPPTNGGQKALDDQYYPRAKYWDPFAAETKAVTIHFEDRPGFSELSLPDTSHVDAADAPKFTRLLLAALVDKGVLPAAPGLNAPAIPVAGEN